VGRGWSDRRTRDAERVASAAWEELVDTLSQAGATARSVRRRTQDLAGEASERVTSATGEARRRAAAARDALSGRRAPVPWAWIGGAVAAGAVLGVLAGVAARRAMANQMEAIALDEAAGDDDAPAVTLVETAVPAARDS
jgi:ElaB/YqjD/DUF883 family membrane-anchored ribosome-binding protein